MEKENHTYKVKCRCCNKITEMYHSKKELVTIKDFSDWFFEHSTFPIQMLCECDKESMILHDLISRSIN